MNSLAALKLSQRTAARRLSPRELADAAVWALREEALLTPKPGLVDQRGSGTHRDMDLPMLLRSASALAPTFVRIAQCATVMRLGAALRERLGIIGREGEAAMLAATGGVNTHRGAIWSVGLLCAAAAIDPAPSHAREICLRAGRIAQLPVAAGMQSSHGRAMFLHHGARGARGEAEDGFPNVYKTALTALRAARARLDNEPLARLHALIALIASVDDTCMLYRGGREVLHLAQDGARRVLALGVETRQGQVALRELDRCMIERNASPGGCADLLAATLFVDRLTQTVEADHGNA